MRNVASISSDESSILILCSLEWSPTQFVLQCDQWFRDGLIFFLSLFIIFRTNVRSGIIPSSCSSRMSLNFSTDKKSNAICIFANLCSTLFFLWFKSSPARFYFLSKCTKKGRKPNGKNLNVDRQLFKM